MTDDHAADTTVGAAANPTASIPRPAWGEAPALAAWADDCDEPATQSAQTADGRDGDESGTQSWAATINYAVFTIVCGLIAAAGAAVAAWWG
ncbi:hypothetical protein MYCODSM44623_01712 [Mycobacterium intracellulare subsp. chimaera]|uniref:hypothetical protein n=1 Tax=Mycobacterium intracellulare TaxID=1767 RepID=UPI00093A8C2C|nr:hypothetical protein [Mycobacterium intracellulare]ASL08462.1 hypothetical protein MYCODSM44623_01712 [Mycobacterium intracellulare subsp. chimaera]MCV7324261.1 hypothetical protein [Mycobacterium intracellulare subsp. chimaera]ORV19990.1 hypothetical protein AWB97_24910 [Mycobacterium intracellulare subsp. chimaera]